MTDMAVADFTNDGLPDVALLCNKTTSRLRHQFVFLYRNPGAANVTDPTQVASPASRHQTLQDYMRILAADVDGTAART